MRNVLPTVLNNWLMVILVLARFGFEPMRADQPTPKRDINAVLRDHDTELLAIPNVVGVYVGARENTNEPCLKVMLRRKPLPTDAKIPPSIEGYPVIIEVTGDIRPLKTP